MQARHAPQDSKILLWSDFATSLYLPLFITYLNYNGLLLSIGKLSSLHNITVLAALELAKYLLYANTHKVPANKHFKDIVKSLSAVVLLFGIIYCVIVLFGAAVFSNFQETFMLSLLITTLTALPICLHFGAENAFAMFLSLISFGGGEIQNLFMLKLRLCLFGAWMGAVVIPLDWNRPWQSWPVPCYFGALGGYVVATWLSLGLQYYRRSNVGKKSGKYAL